MTAIRSAIVANAFVLGLRERVARRTFDATVVLLLVGICFIKFRQKNNFIRGFLLASVLPFHHCDMSLNNLRVNAAEEMLHPSLTPPFSPS